MAGEYNKKMQAFKFDEALKILWLALRAGDETLSDKKPWQIEDKKKIEKILKPIAQNILNVANLLKPFMPTVAERIIAQFSAKQIKKGESLFPRI